MNYATTARLQSATALAAAVFFAIWLMTLDDEVGWFVAVTVAAAVALDVAHTVHRRRSLEVVATATGTYDVDEAVLIGVSHEGAGRDRDYRIVAPLKPYYVAERDPARGQVRYLVFFERGVHDRVELRVLIRSYLGFHTHYSVTNHAVDVVVGPRAEPGQVDEFFPDSDRELVGVRQYQRGDPLGRVHWRSTARTQTLMVKAEEPRALEPSSSLTVVVGWLVEGDPDSERALGRARTYAERGLDLGFEVSIFCVTDGPDPVERPVRSREDVLQRLAQARPSQTSLTLPPGARGIVVHPEGDRCSP